MSGWRPSADRGALVRRAELSRRVRAFFMEREVLEVETPILAPAAPTDPCIHSLSTNVAGLGRRFLQTSPEFPMKRLLAAGIGDCWQLCRVFRDGEHGRMHTPEFTMLEWYRLGWNDCRLMEEVDALVRHVCAGMLELGPTRWITWNQAMAAVDPSARAALDIPDGLSSDQVDDLVMGALVAPSLGYGGPCFVTDWPASQAALARLRDDDPAHAARFELFIDGVELANGYHELGDAAEQRRRFEADNRLRTIRGLPTMPMDRDLLAALEHGLPECAGVALGFDRLVMLAVGARDLRDVLSFAP